MYSSCTRGRVHVRVLLVGDFNIHYDMPFKSDVSRFAIIQTSAGLAQHTIDPTHRCGHTIDLFITRHDDLLIMKYFIARSNFTKDHYMINCVLDLPKPLASKVTDTIRKYKLIDHESFSQDLAARMHDIAYHEYDNINDMFADYNKARKFWTLMPLDPPVLNIVLPGMVNP